MTRTILRRFGWTLVLGLSMATVRAPAADGSLEERLERRVYQDASGAALPYRFLVPPAATPERPCPLIVFLHGAGERGSDNVAQLKHRQVLRLISAEVQARHPAFFLAPQCPVDCRWVEVPWGDVQPHQTPSQPSRPMRLLLQLVDQLCQQYAIDPQRRYITGMSMGGYGTLDAVVRRPKFWAAAVPVCGGADDSRAADFAQLPLWIFHGGVDTVVPPARSRSLVKALEAAGGHPRYKEFPGVGHGVWEQAYHEPELVEWLFGQRRLGD